MVKIKIRAKGSNKFHYIFGFTLEDIHLLMEGKGFTQDTEELGLPGQGRLVFLYGKTEAEIATRLRHFGAVPTKPF